jgi:hypothetical protein
MTKLIVTTSGDTKIYNIDYTGVYRGVTLRSAQLIIGSSAHGCTAHESGANEFVAHHRTSRMGRNPAAPDAGRIHPHMAGLAFDLYCWATSYPVRLDLDD